jgi:hypothetical protein
MRRRWLSLLVAAQTLLLLYGCSSQAVQVAEHPTGTQQVGEVAQGSACGVLVLGLIPAGVNSRTESAYNQALAGHRGLTDTKIQYSWYGIPYVGYVLCTTVEGRVIE